jgi:hypothetical protein
LFLAAGTLLSTSKSRLAEEPRYTGGAYLIIEVIKIEEKKKQ